MKKNLLVLLTTILSIHCYSQVTFENGYYLTDNGQRIEGQIKNMDWKNNPSEFVFRQSEMDEPEIKKLETIKEFGISNHLKFVKRNVDIDRSNESINKLGYDRAPQFQKEQLFLRVLIEGQKSLYSYEDGKLIRYFYSESDSLPRQLIHKAYKISAGKVGWNNRYKQQLLNNFICPDITLEKIEKVDYKKNDLVNFFIKYNECINSDYERFEENKKRDLINLTITPRYNNSSLRLLNSSINPLDVVLNNSNLTAGIEAEFIIPVNNNKWSFTVGPSYQYFQSAEETEVRNAYRNTYIVEVDYKSVEIPIGPRYYFFINEKSRLFIDASYVLDFALDSQVSVKKSNGLIETVEIGTGHNLAFGVGFKFLNYSLKYQYQTKRDILIEAAFWTSEYRTHSLVLGYSLF